MSTLSANPVLPDKRSNDSSRTVFVSTVPNRCYDLNWPASRLENANYLDFPRCSITTESLGIAALTLLVLTAGVEIVIQQQARNAFIPP